MEREELIQLIYLLKKVTKEHEGLRNGNVKQVIETCEAVIKYLESND